MKPRPKPHGQIRQSQVVTTFGPGALVDLPKYAVIIGGLEFWTPMGPAIPEPRLLAKLETILEVPGLALHAPPADPQDWDAPPAGITAWQFPEWFLVQHIETENGGSLRRARRLVHRKELTNGKWIDEDKKKRTVVPVRFVRACRRGHVDDIDWMGFVHDGKRDCTIRTLWIEDRGPSGDLADVVVRCDCDAERSMIDAAWLKTGALGKCNGARPWLGGFAREACPDEPSRLLVRHASNAYFPQVLSVISIPGRDEELAAAVSQVWDTYLQYVTSREEVAQERQRKPPVGQALEGYTDEQVWAEMQVRRGAAASASTKQVKQAELEMLLASKEEVGTDRPDGVFFARALPRAKWASDVPDIIERVVLVHRLREVIAQVGFTRFEAIGPDQDGELDVGVSRAALAQEVKWLPAVENRGEGVFIGFDAAKLKVWMTQSAVKKRGEQLLRGFDCWKAEHPGSKRDFFGLPYIALHSLSHLLLTAVALECGYPASSIRERVYASESWGYGILLYTASPDAEGTLGGLVEAGRRIAKHLRAALEMAALCSNDPVCAHHRPDDRNEARFLHGAACHGCLLISETSCEQRNDFLDRALVVPTVENLGAELFEPPA
jgi:hypothetical protein